MRVERQHRKSVPPAELLTELTGVKPVGWMTGRPEGPIHAVSLSRPAAIFHDRGFSLSRLPIGCASARHRIVVIPYSYEAKTTIRFNEK